MSASLCSYPLYPLLQVSLDTLSRQLPGPNKLRCGTGVTRKRTSFVFLSIRRTESCLSDILTYRVMARIKEWMTRDAAVTHGLVGGRTAKFPKI